MTRHGLNDGPTTSKDRVRSTMATVAFALLCCLVAAHYTLQVDIGLYDETAYLQRGAAIDSGNLPSADMAPLYSLWYRTLQAFVGDPVWRYYVNYGLTTALFPFGIFLLLRSLRTSITVSMAAGTFVLCTTMNVLNWPRVSVFALLLLITGLLLKQHSAQRDRGWYWLFVSVVLSVFVRPEFALSVAGIGLLWSMDIRTRLRTNAIVQWRYPSIALLSALLVLGVFGNPFGHGRSMIAFGQHYALNWTGSNASDLDPWTNWETIVQSELGTTKDLSTAVANAPERMLWHFGMNLKNTVPTLIRMFVPAGARATRLSWLIFGVLGILLSWRAWKCRGQEHTFARIILVLSLPAVVSVVLINPRQHYLIFPAALLLILLVHGEVYTERWKRTAAWLFGISFLAFAMLKPINEKGKPITSTIAALRSIRSASPLVILDADGGYDAYLNDDAQRRTAQEKTDGLYAFLNANAVNVIVSSDRLRRDQRFAADPQWQAFIAGDYVQHYNALPVQGTSVVVYVKRDVQP